MGLIVACFGVLICWFFRFTMQYFYNLDELNGIIYDLNLITVSDYTVSSYIDPSMYQNFIQSLKGDTENAIPRFSNAIKVAVQDYINDLEQNSKGGQKKRTNEIFDVQLAFKQGKMFDFLKKRAKKLKKGNFEAAEAVEREMTEWKDKNFEEYRRPVYTFITLETEKMKNKIRRHKIPFYGGFLKLHRAAEASDIIWENQH